MVFHIIGAMVCECLWAMISNTHKSTGNLKKRIKINIKYTHAFELFVFFYQNLKLLGACVVFFKRIVCIFFEVVCLQLSLNKQGAKLCIKHKWEAAQLNQKRCPHRTLHIDMAKTNDLFGYLLETGWAETKISYFVR